MNYELTPETPALACSLLINASLYVDSTYILVQSRKVQVVKSKLNRQIQLGGYSDSSVYKDDYNILLLPRPKVLQIYLVWRQMHSLQVIMSHLHPLTFYCEDLEMVMTPALQVWCWSSFIFTLLSRHITEVQYCTVQTTAAEHGHCHRLKLV